MNTTYVLNVDALTAARTARLLALDDLRTLIAAMEPVETPPVDAPPPPIVMPPGDLFVHPEKALSSALYADHSLYVEWQRSMGDWYDGDGVLHGPKPTISASGTTVTVDVGELGDVMVQGSPIKQLLIDGADATAAAFWSDGGSAYAQNMPSQNGRPVIVPNPSSGSKLTIVGTGSGTWRIDALACPPAAIPAPVEGFTPPDLLRIDPSDFASVVIPGSTPAASNANNVCFGGEREFLTTPNGVRFVRCYPPKVYEPTHGYGRVMRVDYPLPPQRALYVGYLIRLGPDAPAMCSDGVKLSGGSGDEQRWSIGEHNNIYYGNRIGRNLPIMALKDYFYSAEAGPGEGAGNGQYTPKNFGFLSTTNFVWVEHGMVCNTFNADGTPNADGIKTTEINGNVVERRLIKWFNSPSSRFGQASKQIYNGGTTSYFGPCYYDDGPFMASTKRIGIDPAFLPLLVA